MTAFLCILALLALVGVGEVRITGTVTAGLLIGMRLGQALLVLGLATLALVSYLS